MANIYVLVLACVCMNSILGQTLDTHSLTPRPPPQLCKRKLRQSGAWERGYQAYVVELSGECHNVGCQLQLVFLGPISIAEFLQM